MIFSRSSSQTKMTSHVILPQPSTKVVLIEFHSCSIWPLDYEIAACNRFSQFFQTLLIIFWLTVLISIDVLQLKLCEVSHKTQVNLIIDKYSEEKSNLVKSGDLVGQPVGQCFLVHEFKKSSSKRQKKVHVLWEWALSRWKPEFCWSFWTSV